MRVAATKGKTGWLVLAAALFLLARDVRAADPQSPPRPEPPRYRVPYQLTDTKHILVRARLNGKGPFHLVLDTGAPALFVSTESARKHGLDSGADGWAELDKLEIEGGPVLEKVKARIETPFQVSGMNAMGLPGIRLDGMLGYSVLAHFRIELDLSKPHMIWTRLDWTPPPPKAIFAEGQAPTELAAMGSLVRLMQFFVQKRPEPIYVQRGFCGIEVEEADGAVVVRQVLPDSPAWQAGIRPGDRLRQFEGKEVSSLSELHALATEHGTKREVTLEVERGQEKVCLTLRWGKGL